MASVYSKGIEDVVHRNQFLDSEGFNQNNHLNTLIQGGKRKWLAELDHVESFRDSQIHTFPNRVARPLDTFSEIAAAAMPVLTPLKSSEFRRHLFGQDRKRFTSTCEQVDLFGFHIQDPLDFGS